MAAERLFTLEEAQALLDAELRAEAERMVDARARGRDLEGRWRRLVIAIGSNGGNFAINMGAPLPPAHQGVPPVNPIVAPNPGGAHC